MSSPTLVLTQDEITQIVNDVKNKKITLFIALLEKFKEKFPTSTPIVDQNLYTKINTIISNTRLNPKSRKTVLIEGELYEKFCENLNKKKNSITTFLMYMDIATSLKSNFGVDDTQFRFARGLAANSSMTLASNLKNYFKQKNWKLNRQQYNSRFKDYKDKKKLDGNKWLRILEESEHRTFMQLDHTRNPLLLIQKIAHIRNIYGWLRETENIAASWNDIEILDIPPNEKSPCKCCKKYVIFYIVRVKGRNHVVESPSEWIKKVLSMDKLEKTKFIVWPVEGLNKFECPVCCILYYSVMLNNEYKQKGKFLKQPNLIWTKPGFMFLNQDVGVSLLVSLGEDILDYVHPERKSMNPRPKKSLKADYGRKYAATTTLNLGSPIPVVQVTGDWSEHSAQLIMIDYYRKSKKKNMDI